MTETVARRAGFEYVSARSSSCSPLLASRFRSEWVGEVTMAAGRAYWHMACFLGRQVSRRSLRWRTWRNPDRCSRGSRR